MSIKLANESYVAGAKEFQVPNGDKTLILYVQELGYIQIQQIAIDATTNKKDALASLIVASVKDKDGNQFEYDEVLNLKKEVSEPILNAVLGVNGLNESKN